jgi:hypothetical protein
MNGQLRFKREGNSLICVNQPVAATPPVNNKKKVIIGSIIVAGIGLVTLFLIDGGIGLLSAGVVEIVKWTSRHSAAIETYIQMASSRKPF